MQDVFADGAPVQLVFHNDDDTPAEFVKGLLRNVFGKPEKDAIAFTARIDQQDRVACGPYPASVAKALLDEARQRIRAAQHGLLITSQAVNADKAGGCALCGAPAPETEVVLKGRTAWLCDDCVEAIARASDESEEQGSRVAGDVLMRHFAGIPRHRLVTTTRQFPGHMHADVQVAVEKLFAAPLHFFGLHEEYRHEILTFARCMRQDRYAPMIAPPQYHELDVGDTRPVKCLQNGLWLCNSGEFRYAVILSLERDHDLGSSIRIEIAVPAGAAGEAFVQASFVELEQAVHAARSYRGKILSFDVGANYGGRARGVMVHRLPPVAREEVILPEPTLRLLDRNILSFIASRDALRPLGQSTRKGILLYGPPGTGKTHTIRYLATNLPGHTTLIITAEQVGLLDAYMNLARLLQPTMIVIEDVDLIARDRDEMSGPCEESLLNKLLNEMDGLKEDADILFVLTTNRPEELEGALAGRPGRIDQAIEVPLPDEIGRGKLARLYGKRLPLDQTIVDDAVRRTDGVSAAFIKELMRRIAQSAVARDGGASVTSGDIDEALNDMLFAGGRLNVKLLGGAPEMAG
jgi:ATP-dependent Clp protease adapter protein ClpS